MHSVQQRKAVQKSVLHQPSLHDLSRSPSSAQLADYSGELEPGWLPLLELLQYVVLSGVVPVVIRGYRRHPEYDSDF